MNDKSILCIVPGITAVGESHRHCEVNQGEKSGVLCLRVVLLDGDGSYYLVEQSRRRPNVFGIIVA
jgi:hypothetical protein